VARVVYRLRNVPTCGISDHRNGWYFRLFDHLHESGILPKPGEPNPERVIAWVSTRAIDGSSVDRQSVAGSHLFDGDVDIGDEHRLEKWKSTIPVYRQRDDKRCKSLTTGKDGVKNANRS